MSAQIVSHAPRDIAKRTSDELLFLGQRCNHDACSLVDFLPFKCQYCSEPFCGSHFLPSSHTCPSLPASYTLDRVAPLCPLCSTPVATFPGEDPNGPMERHFSSGKCGVAEDKKVEMRRRRERGEICWRKGCGKALIARIRCESCGKSLCPSHRFPKDHQCVSLFIPTSTASSSTSSLATSRPSAQKPSPTTNSSLFGGLKNAFASSSTSSTTASKAAQPKTRASTSQLPAPGPKQAAAMAAMKRFGQNVTPSTVSPNPPSSSTSGGTTFHPSSASQPRLHGSAGPVGKTSSRQSGASGASDDAGQGIGGGLKKLFGKIGPISADEKHAKQESDALLLSLENRHKRGLLSKSDQLRYAELVAQRESARRKGTKGHPIEL